MIVLKKETTINMVEPRYLTTKYWVFGILFYKIKKRLVNDCFPY